jgi:hypothetical protein
LGGEIGWRNDYGIFEFQAANLNRNDGEDQQAQALIKADTDSRHRGKVLRVTRPMQAALPLARLTPVNPGSALSMGGYADKLNWQDDFGATSSDLHQFQL